MNDLGTLERQVDAVDEALVALLNRRFALSRQVCARRRANGLGPVDPARERATCAKAVAAADPAERDTVYGVYEQILGGVRGIVETVARGVCVRNGRVLLCRAKGGQSTYLPGGHIDFGETGREALVREIREELGVDSSATDFLGVVENRFEQNGKRHAEINLVYGLELARTDAESQEDWISFEWCPLADLPKASLLPAQMAALVTARA